MKSSPLKTERKHHGWSQTKLAKILGVGVATVARWEQGRAVPYPRYRKRLAALFDKTPQQLGLLPDADKQGEAPPTAVRSETAEGIR